MKTWRIFPVLALVAGGLMAGQDISRDCATSEETNRKLDTLHKWVSLKQAEREGRMRSAAAAQPASVSNGIAVVEATPENSPFRKPFDLHNSSLFFSRGDGTAFTADRRPLEYDNNTGASAIAFDRDTTFPYALQNFSFPFFDKQVSQIHISLYSIFLSFPPSVDFYQYGPLETATRRVPMIAPLLMTRRAPFPVATPNLYIMDTPDTLTLTWRTRPSRSDYFRYDIQATLFRNGDIRFSYKELHNLTWGTPVVTSGEEPWRSATTTLGSATDPPADLDPRTDITVGEMLDIENVEVNRIGGSNLLEIRIRVKTAIDRTRIRPDDELQYFIDFSSAPGQLQQFMLLAVQPSQPDIYVVPGWGVGFGSPAAMVEGNLITMRVLQEYLPLTQAAVTLFVATSHLEFDDLNDVVTVPVTIAEPANQAETDFTLLTPIRIERPIFEAFTAPVFNPAGVWNQLRSEFGLKDADVDGVFMYQTYMTDIMFYAGAYSTGGNPGVDGISTRFINYGVRYPKRPALMHMNTFDYGWNDTDRGSVSVSLHEFGHRWLYYLRIIENGARTRSLNPVSSHPAEYVHTPAPFTVYSAGDASTMGGSRWTDHGNGTFTTPDALGYYSYSWTDLYLMGLAAPEEVEPWFYIANSSVPFSGQYSPAPRTFVSGTRKDVQLQQVIDAMGPRQPTHQQAQRTFTVLFVLVTEPGVAPTAAQMEAMDEHRRLFEEQFRIATGRRGEAATFFRPPGGPRRRGVRP